MQFRPIKALSFLARAAAPSAGTPSPSLAKAPAAPPPAPATGRQALVESAQNLLKHIPGEASGFYLMAVSSFEKPSLIIAGLICALALILLVVVRWLAKASAGIMWTTMGAFALWMLVLDKGLLNLAFPNLLPDPLGLILAVFYSTLITLLAGAGIIR
jgi:hypothetical protein